MVVNLTALKAQQEAQIKAYQDKKLPIPLKLLDAYSNTLSITDGGGGGGGGGSSLTQVEVQTAITSALNLQSQREFTERMLVDANGIFFLRRGVLNESNGTYTETNLNLDGTAFVGNPVTPIKPASTGGINSLSVFSSSGNDTIIAGATGNTFSLQVNVQSSLLELNCPTLTDGTNFYVEIKQPGSTQWSVVSWTQLYNPHENFITINEESTYRSEYYSLRDGITFIDCRIVNIGSVTLNAGAVFLTTSIGDKHTSINPTSVYRVRAQLGTGVNTVTIFLPQSLTKKRPKLLAVFGIRTGTISNSEPTNLIANYTFTYDKQLSSGVGTPITISTLDYTANQNFNSIVMDSSAATLQPLVSITITRTNSIAVATYNITLEY